MKKREGSDTWFSTQGEAGKRLYFFVIELDVVVVQANKEKGKRFLSMDVVDDVIDHLFLFGTLNTF
jgi:hypothetical protein